MKPPTIQEFLNAKSQIESKETGTALPPRRGEDRSAEPTIRAKAKSHSVFGIFLLLAAMVLFAFAAGSSSAVDFLLSLAALIFGIRMIIVHRCSNCFGRVRESAASCPHCKAIFSALLLLCTLVAGCVTTPENAPRHARVVVPKRSHEELREIVTQQFLVRNWLPGGDPEILSFERKCAPGRQFLDGEVGAPPLRLCTRIWFKDEGPSTVIEADTVLLRTSMWAPYVQENESPAEAQRILNTLQ